VAIENFQKNPAVLLAGRVFIFTHQFMEKLAAVLLIPSVVPPDPAILKFLELFDDPASEVLFSAPVPNDTVLLLVRV
jgi:hypothetical protein